MASSDFLISSEAAEEIISANLGPLFEAPEAAVAAADAPDVITEAWTISAEAAGALLEDTVTHSDDFELHDLIVDNFPNARIGLRLDKESLTVTGITDPETRKTWCMGDQVKAVGHQRVTNYEELLSILGGECKDLPFGVTVLRNKAQPNMSEKATIGMLGGIAGGALFGCTCVFLVGGGWVAGAAALVPVWIGGLSGSAAGACGDSRENALCAGAIAGFAGPTATTMVLGSAFAYQACVDTSEVDV